MLIQFSFFTQLPDVCMLHFLNLFGQHAMGDNEAELFTPMSFLEGADVKGLLKEKSIDKALLKLKENKAKPISYFNKSCLLNLQITKEKFSIQKQNVF